MNIKSFFLLLALFTIITNIMISQTVNEEWVARYKENENDTNIISGIVTDNFMNVYVTGSSENTTLNTKYDILTIKYNEKGETQWIARFNSSENGDDWSSGLCVDKTGNVYVTGSTSKENSGSEYITIKYNTNGEQQWIARYSRDENSKNTARAIALDSSENIYVVGLSYIENKRNEIVTIKYNSNGETLLTLNFNGLEKNLKGALPFTIMIDGFQNIIIGMTIRSLESDMDYGILKYNSKGILQWLTSYNGPYNGIDAPEAMTCDKIGNVYITGSSVGIKPNGSPSYCDYATIKYSALGNEEWIARYNGKGDNQDIGESITTDNKGNVYVTGSSIFSTGDNKAEHTFAITTIKYNSSGIEQWVRSYEGGWGNSIGVDNLRNVYIIGESYLEVGADCITLKYNENGEEEWRQTYNSPEKSFFIPKKILIDNNYNVLIASYDSKYYFTTIKYSQANIIHSYAQLFYDAKKAFADGEYLLVLELLKDFSIDDPLYYDAISLMNQALEKLPRNSNQNFVTVSGKINCSCNKLINGYIIFQDLNTRLNVGKCRITSDGYYCIILPSGKIYSYYIDAKDFYPVSRVVDFTSSKQTLNHKDNIALVSYDEMKEKQLSVRINNIFFDFNKSELKSESYLELDRLYNFLKDNPEIKVEISGHTDNVGTDEYNMNLSQARANTVKEYLVGKGIDSERIISKGYGKSKPVSTNDTDEGRQLNRRVEFKILK
jgi:outer membrane protein OmpA-like peptidoglycan-associated protein